MPGNKARWDTEYVTQLYRVLEKYVCREWGAECHERITLHSLYVVYLCVCKCFIVTEMSF